MYLVKDVGIKKESEEPVVKKPKMEKVSVKAEESVETSSSRCETCNVTFRKSDLDAERHYNGKRHLAKVANSKALPTISKEDTKQDATLNSKITNASASEKQSSKDLPKCETCNVTFTSEVQ